MMNRPRNDTNNNQPPSNASSDIDDTTDRSNLSFFPEDFVPGNWDVICQRGRENFDHVGNRRFRLCIDNNIETYLKAKTKQAKTDIVNNVLESIRNSSPNGGFIRKDLVTGRWYEVDMACAREKVGQAIRDAIKQRRASKKKPPMLSKPSSEDRARPITSSSNPDQTLSRAPPSSSSRSIAMDTSTSSSGVAATRPQAAELDLDDNVSLTRESIRRSQLFATHASASIPPPPMLGDRAMARLSGGQQSLIQHQDNLGFLPRLDSFDRAITANISQLPSFANENPLFGYDLNNSLLQHPDQLQPRSSDNTITSSRIHPFNVGPQVDSFLDQQQLGEHLPSRYTGDSSHDPHFGQYWSSIDSNFLPIRTGQHPVTLRTRRTSQFSREDIEEAKQPSNAADSDTHMGFNFGQFPPY